MTRRLMTLTEWEEIADRHRADDLAQTINVPNGIACPKCDDAGVKTELVDADRRIRLTSHPPQYIIRCRECGWVGHRHIV